MTITSTVQTTMPDPLADFSIFDVPLGVVSLTGEDNKKYLQGQLTCDLNELSETQPLLGAHCDAKGKMQAILRLFEHNGEVLALHPLENIEPHLPELKKYAVFSKVTITDHSDQWKLVGFGGENAKGWLKETFGGLPEPAQPCLSLEHGLLYLHPDQQRYLLLLKSSAADSLLGQLPDNGVRYSAECWNSLDILAGMPVITPATHLEYVPQMLNLQMIDGINFKKGCYTGQETVARLHYRGQNKRAMFILRSNSAVEVQIGDSVEKPAGENWRGAGTVINVGQDHSGHTIALAVLSADLEPAQPLRLKNDHSPLTLVHPDYFQQD